MAQYSVLQPRGASPWSALSQLQRELGSFFDRPAGRVGAGPWRGAYPPVNLYEATDAYILSAELPGVSPDDIHVSVAGSTIEFSGERKTLVDQGDASLHRRERQSGSFRRAFTLPDKVDVDNIEAVHRNGVLMLRVPKRPEAQPRQIHVQSSQEK